MRLADWLERVGRFLLQYWYLDISFAVAGSLLLFLALKLRERHGSRVNRRHGILRSGRSSDANPRLEDGATPEANLGDLSIPPERNGEAKGRASPNEAGDEGDEA